KTPAKKAAAEKTAKASAPKTRARKTASAVAATKAEAPKARARKTAKAATPRALGPKKAQAKKAAKKAAANKAGSSWKVARGMTEAEQAKLIAKIEAAARAAGVELPAGASEKAFADLEKTLGF